MGKALYRKYRSRTLDEIIGQPHVVSLLTQSLKHDTTSHAYLLTGIRGVGKTSIARILAHEIAGLPYQDTHSHLDIIEIDAASNNSVEDIRTLRDNVQVAPAIAKKKVYIIDEVHMLSKSAFNALLKTLEEPPAHAVFILATTDADKLPATILSRVQRLNLRPVSEDDIVLHLKTISKSEGIQISTEALALIARHARGSFRDAISLLDQLRNQSSNQIDTTHVEAMLGLVSETYLDALIAAYQIGDISAIIQQVDQLERTGATPTLIIEQLLGYGRAKLPDNPWLMPLLDALVESRRSEWPDVKLLSALVLTGPASLDTSHTPASPAPTPTPLPRVGKQSQHGTMKKAPMKKTKANDAPETTEVAENQSIDKPAEAPEEQLHMPTSLRDFPWQSFIETVKQSSMGAYSVLTKSSHAYDGDRLYIYAGKSFAKKQLDKAAPNLSEALQIIGVGHATLQIIASSLPSDDADAAAAMAIMGGGEEVAI